MFGTKSSKRVGLSTDLILGSQQLKQVFADAPGGQT